MDILEIIFLGILQGVTEFFPVSSSGHVVLFNRWLGFESNHIELNIILHVGTLFSIFTFYHKPLFYFIRSIFRNFLYFGRREQHISRESVDLEACLLSKVQLNAFLIYILIAGIPTAVIGLYLESFVRHNISLFFLGACFLLTGVIIFALYFFEKIDGNGKKRESTSSITRDSFKSFFDLGYQRGSSQLEGRENTLHGQGFSSYKNFLSWKSCLRIFFIGAFQGLSVIPGLSRSGWTISAARFLGMSSQQATFFSFVILIPALLGAVALEWSHLLSMALGVEIILYGFFSSYITGVLALNFLTFVIRKNQLYWFGYYLIVVSFLCFLV